MSQSYAIDVLLEPIFWFVDNFAKYLGKVSKKPNSATNTKLKKNCFLIVYRCYIIMLTLQLESYLERKSASVVKWTNARDFSY